VIFLLGQKNLWLKRIHLIDEQIPIYFLHGEQSWIDTEPSQVTHSIRRNVFIDTMKDAGHHVYADSPEEFDIYLKKILLNKEQ